MMGNWLFLAGLGISTIASRSAGPIAGLIITLVAAGVFVLLGHFAKQGQTWALILGIVFYALDTVLVLLLMTQAWFLIAFHAYALFMIFKTFSAIKLYEQAKEQAAAQGIMV